MWASGGRTRGKTTRMVERAVENRRCVMTTYLFPRYYASGMNMRCFMFTVPTGMPYGYTDHAGSLSSASVESLHDFDTLSMPYVHNLE